MIIKAIALDDEPPALSILSRFCEQIEGIVLVKTFTKPSAALDFIVDTPPDLLFLDVNMPTVSGIDFYKMLDNKIPFILTTAYTEYAIEGFNLNAIDYLLKPYTLARLHQAVEKAQIILNASSNTPPQYLWVRADYTLHKIPFSDILFVEALDDYVKIHIHNSKMIVARLTMKKVLEKLPNSDFLRVHKSYIVAIKYVESLRNKTIFIKNQSIPIGGSYERIVYTTLQL